MLPGFISLAVGLLGKLLGSLFGKKDPSAVTLATQAATAQTQLASQEAANEVLVQGAAARAAADTQRVLHDPNAAQVHADPGAAINLGADGKPDPDLRD